MQDVCISFWRNDGSADMIVKVTDICSTDPSDPSYCATPADIKVTKSKAFVMEGFAGQPGATIENTPQFQGAQYPDQIWWFFTKCWADVCRASFTPFPQSRSRFDVNYERNFQRPSELTPLYKATVQTSYGDNWFAQPPLPNNLKAAQDNAFQQMLNNQQSYPAKGWAQYPNGGYNPERDASTSPPISDWAPGQPDPAWTPIAGGKGYSGKF